MIGSFGSRGMSLIEVIIALGLTSIMFMGMTSMFEHQNREARALGEKLAAADLEKILIAALSDGSVCKYVLNPPSASSLTFNSQAISPTTPQTIDITSPLYASVAAGSPPTPGPIVAQIGASASGYSSSLIVKSIKLQITSGSNGSYMGNWLIGFDSAKTVRPLAPVSIATALTVSTAAPHSLTSAAITNCQNAKVAGGEGALKGFKVFRSTSTWAVPAEITNVLVTAIGGGGGGSYFNENGSFLGAQGTASLLQGCSAIGGGGQVGVYPYAAGGSASGGTVANINGASGPSMIDNTAAYHLPFVPDGAGNGGGMQGTIAPGAEPVPAGQIPSSGTGGGGGIAISNCTVTPGAVLAVTVGTGGLGRPIGQTRFPDGAPGAVVLQW